MDEYEAPAPIDPNSGDLAGAISAPDNIAHIAPPEVTTPDDLHPEGTTTPEESLANAEATNPGASTKTVSDRPRGWLEAAVKSALDKVLSGEIKPQEVLELDKEPPLTPHFVSLLVTKIEGLESRPSTGAVAAVFARWDEVKAVQLEEKPLRFVGFTDEANSQGIDALKAAHKQSKKDEKAANAAEAASSDEPA